jgi:threonine synthase
VNAIEGARLICAGCGTAARDDDPYPFACPRAGEGDADHVLTRTLVAAHVPAPDEHANPFVRWRGRLRAWHLARARGMSDADFVALVEDLDARVAAVDGHGFRVTPFAPAVALSSRLGFASRGGIWVKNETGNVAGSHKGRHLFGLALHLEVAERTGLTTRAMSDSRGLAIASCGNAALAAAVVAKAAGRPLSVFIPADADARVVERLRALDARIEVCVRGRGVPGDPCIHGFHRALAAGALPFCVQGNECGLTVEGGMTLAWELADQLMREGMRADRLFVQVGGGALASSCGQGLAEAAALAGATLAPRLHAVQTRGAMPLRRAYERARARVFGDEGVPGTSTIADDEALSAQMATAAAARAVGEALVHARTHRGAYMWPWEEAPHSVAHGILDDETYDWSAIVAAMLEGGGYPVIADELTLKASALLAGQNGIPADATGAAGLAGLITLRRAGVVRDDERVVILMTGARRD